MKKSREECRGVYNAHAAGRRWPVNLGGDDELVLHTQALCEMAQGRVGPSRAKLGFDKHPRRSALGDQEVDLPPLFIPDVVQAERLERLEIFLSDEAFSADAERRMAELAGFAPSPLPPTSRVAAGSLDTSIGTQAKCVRIWLRTSGFQNEERPHEALGYRTPFAVYTAAPAIAEAA